MKCAAIAHCAHLKFSKFDFRLLQHWLLFWEERRQRMRKSGHLLHFVCVWWSAIFTLGQTDMDQWDHPVKKIKMAPSSLVLAATDFILRAAACWRVYRPNRGRNIRFGQRRGGQIDNQPTRPPRWKYIRGFLLFGILCSGRWFSCWQHRVFPGVATSFPPTQSNRTWAKIAWAPSADQPPASAPDLPPKVPHPRPSLPTYRTTQIRLPWPRQQAATALSEWFNVHNFKALANSTS